MCDRFFRLLFVVSLILRESSGLLFRQSSATSPGKKPCCRPPKMNVDSIKANRGRAFLERLATESTVVTPNEICHLMHFLFQQATINRKPAAVSEGMFILFDSSHQVFNRILNRSVSVADVQPTPMLTDRYPTYGMEIPGSCLLSNFNHVLFGELPPFLNGQKYAGQRFFFQVGRVGFEQLRNDVRSVIKQVTRQSICRLVRGESKAECAKLRAFKQNVDRSVLKRWKHVLTKIPAKWQLNNQYKERAIKYGISEIDQQSSDLQAAGAGRYVKGFRKFLVKRYGEDDLAVRKGQELIFTLTDLRQRSPTCEPRTDLKRC